MRKCEKHGVTNTLPQDSKRSSRPWHNALDPGVLCCGTLDVCQRPHGERGVSSDESRHFHGSLFNFTCKHREITWGSENWPACHFSSNGMSHENTRPMCFFECRRPLLSFQTCNTRSSHLRKASSPLWLQITRCCLHALCNLAARSSYRACRHSAGDVASHASSHHSPPSASLSPTWLSSISSSQAAFPSCKSPRKLLRWQILAEFLVIGG